jgi:hypothetical protein
LRGTSIRLIPIGNWSRPKPDNKPISRLMPVSVSFSKNLQQSGVKVPRGWPPPSRCAPVTSVSGVNHGRSTQNGFAGSVVERQEKSRGSTRGQGWRRAPRPWSVGNRMLSDSLQTARVHHCLVVVPLANSVRFQRLAQSRLGRTFL